MSTSTQTQSYGMGLGEGLLVLFITLKLCKVIDWNWWWVLSPFWIPLGIVLVVLIIVALIKGLSS